MWPLELCLASNHLAHKLGPTDYRHINLGSVTSTSDVCFQKAGEGEASGLWVLAESQTGGRGRRGRAWVSKPGNFYASLLLIDDGRPDLSALPLAVAVAVARAIDYILPDNAPKTHVKWPNDILIAGQKVCGMLLEVEMLENGQRAIVLGCGINMAHHPSEALYPTCATSGYGSDATPHQLLPYIMAEISDILDIWDNGQHISAIRKLWLDKAAGVGQLIEVRLPNKSLSGLFVGLAQNGNLILKRDDGSQLQIAAGDVFLSRAAR